MEPNYIDPCTERSVGMSLGIALIAIAAAALIEASDDR
jgi:hypothetical protein